MAIFAVSLQIFTIFSTEMFLDKSSTIHMNFDEAETLQHVHDISLYIICVFYCRYPCGFVAMAT